MTIFSQFHADSGPHGHHPGSGMAFSAGLLVIALFFVYRSTHT